MQIKYLILCRMCDGCGLWRVAVGVVFGGVMGVVFVCAEQMKQQQRGLRKTNRELERDRSALERQERQLVCV